MRDARPSAATPPRQPHRGLRAQFGRGARNRTPVAVVAKAIRSGDIARNKAIQHFEKNKDSWTERRFTKLLMTGARTLSLDMPGVPSDPKAAMMSRAKAEVSLKQASRLARIDRASANMAASGRVRATRNTRWGQGLGE